MNCNQNCFKSGCNQTCQSCQSCSNFNNWNNGQGCNNDWNTNWNSNWNGNCPRPLVAPTRVCTTCQNQYVEQPVICPIECRRVNNVVLVPRYYPRYVQTSFVQSNNNSVF